MGAIRDRRRRQWAAWNAATPRERGAAGIEAVVSRDGGDVGYAISRQSDCRCEGVGACNLRVIWSDGALTKCCTRGMAARRGGWSIR